MLTDFFCLLLTHLAVGLDLPLGGWLGAADSSAASGDRCNVSLEGPCAHAAKSVFVVMN